jgi:uncharacterized membrane protein YphA (DoxX/SURF4 family)
MNIVLWIAAGLLALAFLAAGFGKLSMPKEKLYEQGMKYVEDFSAGQIKGIGAVEVLGAIGVIAPAFVDSVSWLAPTAAAGLAATMIGAIITHARRKESFVPALVLGVLAAFVAIGRFWLSPF